MEARQAVRETFRKDMWLWLRERWKIVLGSILGLLGILSVYLRLRGQKEVLQKANESHEKDNKINDAAIKELTSGMEEIATTTADNLEDARIRHEKKSEEIKKSKDDLTKEVLHDDSLAKKLAEELGAKYVEKD